MSVDFQIEWNSTGTFTFDCYGNDDYRKTTYGPFPTRDEGLLAVTAHKMTCVECDIYGCYLNVVVDVDRSINMSNTNATMILGIMGIPVDFEYGICGSMKAEEFLGYVMVALAQERDHAAVAATVDAQPGRATFIDCGLPAYYVEDHLAALADLATEAVHLGRDICWS